MFNSAHKYTIGRYNEVPEGVLSNSGSALLAKTLAWAAENDIPFSSAVRSLFEKPYVRFRFPPFNSKNWSEAVQLVYDDLQKGRPLHYALRRRMHHFLPEYYLQAVEQAENDGTLAQVLPHFAKRINLASEIELTYLNSLNLPVSEACVILLVLLFIRRVVLPNFIKIFDELVAGKAPYFYLMVDFFDIVFPVICLSFISVFVIYYIKLLLPGWIAVRISMVSETFIMLLPAFRRQLKNIALLQLSASMASYLSAGHDVIDAAKFSLKACNHFWLRRRLKKFIAMTEKGQDWLTAWNYSIGNGRPLDDWIIRNAASKEDLASGFDTMADWLYHKIIRNASRNSLFVGIFLTLINAGIVFGIAYAVFKSFCLIIMNV